MTSDNEKKKIAQAKYRAKNKEKINAWHRERKLNMKFKVLEQYGTACKICGFSDYRALQIDHINDNGAEERKSLGGQNFSGWRFYEWLIANDFPEGYQTLCANHNNIKQWEKNNLA